MSVNATGCARGKGNVIAAQAEPWPVYLGVASRGPSALESLAAEPRLIWRTQVGRAVPGGVAITERLVVAGTSDRRLAVLDRRTGEVLWNRKMSGSVASTPLVVGGTLYVGTEPPKGRVEAYDLTTRKRRWQADVAEVSSHLALFDDLLLVPQPGRITALDTATGEPQWSTQIAGVPRAPPSVLARHIFVSTHVDSAFLLLRSTGAIVDRLPLAGAVTGAPAVFGPSSAGTLGLVAATTTGRVYAWHELPDSLAPLWELDVAAPVVGSVVVARDTAFLVTRPGTLWRIPLDAPDRAVTIELGAAMVAPPTPLANGLVLATLSGEILFLDRGSARPRTLARVDAPATEPPLVKGGDLVVVGGRGHILLYR